MISVAVVGIGRMGGKHASNFCKGAVKNAKLVAVCDIDGKVLEAFQAKHTNVAVYSDYDKMLCEAKPDAVIVATPHYSHSALAKKALEKGISVLVEKPITVTVKDANSVIEVAKAHPEAVFAIMYNQRSNSIYARAKKIIESGKLGDLQRASFTVTDWYRTQYYYNMGGWRASWSGEGGGTLINQCVHQIDILQWLLGMPEKIISRCKTEGRKITTENDVTALFLYKNYDCVFTSSTHELPGENRLVIVGSKGTMTITRHKAVIKYLKMDEKEVNARAKRDYGNRADKKYTKKYMFYGLKNYITDGLYGQQCNILRDFAAAVENKDPSLLRARGEEGVNALNIINAINMSAWKGKEVNVPVDPEEYEKMLAEKIASEKKIK